MKGAAQIGILCKEQASCIEALHLLCSKQCPFATFVGEQFHQPFFAGFEAMAARLRNAEEEASIQ